MAKYDKNFKLLCINAYEQRKPLPKIEGILERSLIRYAKQWRLIYKEMGEKGLEDGFLQHNFTVKDKIKAIKMVCNAIFHISQVPSSYA